MQRFRNAGINLREYAESTNLQQLQQIWTTNGYEDLISAEKLGEYARRAGYNLDRLKTIISEEESPYIAQQFEQNYKRAFEIIESFRDQMRTNPTFFALVAGGIDEQINKYSFQGDKSKAFTQIRLGTEIGYTGLEKALIMTGDVVLNPLTYIGATAAFKVAGLKGVGIIAGTDLGSDIAFSQSFAAIEGVSPETARAISLVMGGLMVKGGYDKISSFIRGGELKVGLLRVGGREIQVYTGSNRALKYAEQGFSGTKNLGNGLYELPDGKQVLLRAAKEEAWNPQLGNNPEYNDLTSTFARNVRENLKRSIDEAGESVRNTMQRASGVTDSHSCTGGDCFVGGNKLEVIFGDQERPRKLALSEIYKKMEENNKIKAFITDIDEEGNVIKIPIQIKKSSYTGEKVTITVKDFSSGEITTSTTTSGQFVELAKGDVKSAGELRIKERVKTSEGFGMITLIKREKVSDFEVYSVETGRTYNMWEKGINFRTYPDIVHNGGRRFTKEQKDIIREFSSVRSITHLASGIEDQLKLAKLIPGLRNVEIVPKQRMNGMQIYKADNIATSEPVYFIIDTADRQRTTIMPYFDIKTGRKIPTKETIPSHIDPQVPINPNKLNEGFVYFPPSDHNRSKEINIQFEDMFNVELRVH